MDRQEQFHQHFHEQIRTLKEQIAQLGRQNAPDDRRAAHDTMLAALSGLSSEVADAAEFMPTYDQRKQAQTLASVQDELKQAMAKVAPKSRFQFKPRGAAAAAAAASLVASPGTSDAAVPNDPRQSVGTTTTTMTAPSAAPTPTISTLPQPPVKDYNAIIASSGSLVRRPSFSSAPTVSLTSHAGLHVALPASKALPAGSITGLRRCVLDMAHTALPTLALRDIGQCVVVVAGPGVDGPVHLTGATGCTLVLAARQVRVHDCEDVDLYLQCGSRPIIEACKGMRFAPIPACCQSQDYDPAQNMWGQVDDFKWLKSERSPNWSVLPEDERVRDETWQEALGGERPVDDTLAMLGIRAPDQ